MNQGFIVTGYHNFRNDFSNLMQARVKSVIFADFRRDLCLFLHFQSGILFNLDSKPIFLQTFRADAIAVIW